MSTPYIFPDPFTPSVLPPAPPSSGAADLVTQGFTTAQVYARDAFNESIAFLSQITSAAANLEALPPVDGTLPPVTTVVSAFVAPATPVAPANLTLNLPAVPGNPTLTPVTGISPGAAPQFTAVALPIDLSFAPPTPLSATVPGAPTLPAVVVPGAPNLVLPDVPTLLGITIPAAPLLNLPIFNAVQPDSPLAPAFYFSFSEAAYTSQLLVDMRTILDRWVNGDATGLAPAVEQAIWDRARAREVTSSQRKIDASIRMFASRGFTKPPGALNLDIQQALQDAQDAISTQSRDVMVKQADLEQNNRHFAFETAWKVEEGLITYQNQISQRAFETAKYAQQAAIDIFHEVVARYSADIQAYIANVEVFKAALQAELAKLDIYKAELEGQRLIGELNSQAVEVYKARIEAARAVVDIFRVQVEAANVSATVNKTQIEAFAAQVNAYGETVRAKASEYDAYATRVKAEVSKIDVFTAQANAYNSQVQGFKATVEALVAQKDIDIKINQELPLEVFKSLTETYRVQVGAEVDRVGALVKEYEAAGQVYGAEVQGEAARVGSQVAVFKANTDLSVATGNLRIEAAKANVQLITQQVQLLIEAIKGGAQVAAQLAAAALSAVNLSGQIGDHTSFGVSYGVSNSSSIASSVSNSNSNSNSVANNTLHEDINSVQNSTSNVTEQIYNYSPT
jgi:hypothetical protein